MKVSVVYFRNRIRKVFSSLLLDLQRDENKMLDYKHLPCKEEAFIMYLKLKLPLSPTD